MHKILYISPHLDDVILSCGATIAQQISNGNQVTIATIFSAGDEKSNHLIRKNDDAKAVKQLGASYLHFDFVDAPFRSQKYYSFASLLYHHTPPTDHVLLQDITKKIAALIKPKGFNQCYFPLGIGGHIDHNLAFYAGKNILKNQVCECYFYEDAPYNQVQNWSNIRKQQCNIEHEYSNSPFTRLKEQHLAFVSNYFINDMDELESESNYKREFEKLHQPGPNPSFKAIKYFNEYDCESKLNALRCYQTEFDILIDEQNIRQLKFEVNYKLIPN
nr:PIG-L family deacetylase [uncultured Carboxylicivirga sp.]